MPIQPWIATCIQTLNHVVNDVSTREDARVIMHRSLDRWESFIKAAVGRAGEGPRQLVLFPEFALTGFPMGESAAQWSNGRCASPAISKQIWHLSFFWPTAESSV